MLSELQKEIASDRQIRRFCAYGFLKDLRFFEPYLLIFLMGKDLGLFEIGILMAVREAVINIFEIPSGFIADRFGRKKELCISFMFYMTSFIFFYSTDSFPMAAAAMASFGAGEAFRSGTHKAMIYTYLDSRGWKGEKTFVYGRTRSFSLIGGALSSLIGILLMLSVTSVNMIFLFSVIPYMLDFALVLSYPGFLDRADRDGSTDGWRHMAGFISDFRKNVALRHILLEEGIFESTVSFIKDLVQPMMEMIVIGSGLAIFSSLGPEKELDVMLGIVYMALNALGAFASRKAHVVKKGRSNMECLRGIHLLLSIGMASLALFSGRPVPVFLIYLFIYAIMNVRKPIFVDEVDEHMERSERATVLSIASMLKSLFLMLFAPVLGMLADRCGIGSVMLLLTAAFVMTLPLLERRDRTAVDSSLRGTESGEGTVHDERPIGGN